MTDSYSQPQKLNELAFGLFKQAIERAEELEIKVAKVGDAKVLDFAVGRTGSTDAGILLSDICLGSLATIELIDPIGDLDLRQVKVETTSPLRACIGSQYAGWPLSLEKYFAMCSGPMRMLRGKEGVLDEYGLREKSNVAVGVLESNQIPDAQVIQKVADSCQVEMQNVCLCVARTASYPGSLQVVARSIETALHKLHELKFDLNTIVNATGTAPLPPIADDDMTALGWTNDAMLYGASVELHLDTTDEAIEAILDQVPSCSSVEFGTPFLDIFNRYEKDFYKIDKMLFSPAEIVIINRRTARRFTAGKTRNDILKSSFGMT